MSLARDLEAIYADTLFADAVRYGRQTTRGFFDYVDMEEESSSGAMVIANRPTLILRRNDLQHLEIDQSITITIDGEDAAFVIRSIRRHETDRQQLRLILAET